MDCLCLLGTLTRTEERNALRKRPYSGPLVPLGSLTPSVPVFFHITYHSPQSTLKMEAALVPAYQATLRYSPGDDNLNIRNRENLRSQIMFRHTHSCGQVLKMLLGLEWSINYKFIDMMRVKVGG